ncbi:MAG: M13 family metallopeptidase [Chitinophagaceae bacterium]|nr:M13 family metallopeptidase [Chitinophagaceae bacterium]
MRQLLPVTILLAAIFIFSCKNSGSEQKTSGFIERTGMDSSIKPGDDFFDYVNGKWVANAVIPATETGAGGFFDLARKSRQDLHDILEDVSKSDHTKGSMEQLVGDFYRSGMDSAAIDKLGYEPLKPFLQTINAIKSPSEIMSFVAEQYQKGSYLLFFSYVGSDEKNSGYNILNFYQGGLGLPDRDYYFRNDPASKQITDAYLAYISGTFKLTGTDSATSVKNALTVYNFEKQLAASHKTRVEVRDPQANYNKIPVAAADKKMPVFALGTFLSSLNIKTDSVNIGQPGFFEKVNQMLQSTPLERWKNYLAFHTIRSFSAALSSDFVNAQFDFSKVMTGQQSQKPRWERMVSRTDMQLGEALGQLYVKKYFSESAKKRMLGLVENLQKAFAARINKLDWMSDSTKTKAKEKLASFTKKIGYPDKWRDYSKVNIDKSDYFNNIIALNEDEFNFQKAKIGKPVDRTEWGMTPPTVDAYYNPPMNEIVFPAGILQPPYFYENADDAINYGGIGMVIGHEMTHGFDDQGAQYDKDGNLKNWWAPEDYEKFKALGQKVIDLYNSFTVLDSLHVNGAATNGENIADIGGLAIAFDAFKLTKQGRDTVKINGLTLEQRFMLSFGLIWRSKMKPEFQRMLINVDVHSPAIWRVNGSIMNFDPFYTQFNVQPGEKMYRADSIRIRIW